MCALNNQSEVDSERVREKNEWAKHMKTEKQNELRRKGGWKYLDGDIVG